VATGVPLVVLVEADPAAPFTGVAGGIRPWISSVD